MSKAEMYGVRNEKGDYLMFSDDGDALWDKRFGNFSSAKLVAYCWKREHGGNIVTFSEAQEPVKVSADEAELLTMLKDNPSDYFVAGNVSDFVQIHWDDYGDQNRALVELRLIYAYINGWRVKKDKRYKVLAPMSWWQNQKEPEYIGRDASGVAPVRTEFPESTTTFSVSELKKYGLDSDLFKKIEVDDDAD